MTSLIRDVYNDDIRDKKRTALGVRGKAGRRSNKVMLPSEMMTGSEARQYKKGSKVMSYNRNEIMEYDKFLTLSKQEQKQLVEYWRNDLEISVSKISKAWKKSVWTLNQFFKKLNVEITNTKLLERMKSAESARKVFFEKSPEERAAALSRSHAQRKENRRQAQEAANQSVEAQKPAQSEQTIEIVGQALERAVIAYTPPQPVSEPIGTTLLNSLSLDIVGTGDDALAKMNKLIAFLQGDSNNFRIEVRITEVRS